MSDHAARLRDKLCRELAQVERDARLHTRREARRLGDVPPARALLAIATHADEVEMVLEKMIGQRQGIGVRIARAVAHAFSGVRHFFLDRLIDRERSYRATLLGLKHGIDTLRLLREVATLNGDRRHLKFCDLVLVERLCLLEDAEQALVWFAEHPQLALGSGMLALPAPTAPAQAPAMMAEAQS
jgi:hypothetical protein